MREIVISDLPHLMCVEHKCKIRKLLLLCELFLEVSGFFPHSCMVHCREKQGGQNKEGGRESSEGGCQEVYRKAGYEVD